MDIRNIAIIAHVDHGKTTLVDGMLKQTHTFRENEEEMSQTTILDRNELEREKGITILAKNIAVVYKNTKINIIDTPGHADFSGEVERVINMADGALLIVDAAEGPLPQTQFVLQKALEQNLKIILVINKIDRKDARPKEVLHETEELFLLSAHHDDHLMFPVLYAVGREEKAWKTYPDDMRAKADLTPLFEEIISAIPALTADPQKPFKMLVSTLDFDTHKGTFAIGKVTQGTAKVGQKVLQMDEQKQLGSFTIQNVLTSKGLFREEISESLPGDIIAISGIPNVAIGQTIADPADPTGYPNIKLGEPTLKVLIGPNTSPLSGREGKFHTARQIEQRLMQEKKTNIGLRIETNPQGGFIVAGRGELHLSILIENLRREGFELQVSKPQVILKKVGGHMQEPFEELTIEIDKSFIGVIIEELGMRKGELLDTQTNEKGTTRMIYRISSRNLLGLRSNILTKTRGQGLFAERFLGYFEEKPASEKLRNGVLIAFESGTSTAYALATVQERGTAFIGPGVSVYEGMIIGLNRRSTDLEINVCKGKKLTNVRSETADIAVKLDPPVNLTLEQSLDFIENDELLEVTPKSLRLRKQFLTKLERNRVAKN